MSALALTQNLGEFLKLFLEAFNLASIFPAFIFVTLTQMFLMPLLPETSPLRIDMIPDLTVRAGFCVVLTVLLGYLLRAANFSIIRFFEGYLFRHQYPFKFFEKKKRDSMVANLRKQKKVESVSARLLDFIVDLDENTEIYRRYFFLYERSRNYMYKYNMKLQKYPYKSCEILPLSLGNVIARSENYSHKLFNIDAITLWGFLVPILNENGYAKFVVREKSMLDFLLNLIVIIFIFCGLYSFINWLYNGWSLYLIYFLFIIVIFCLFLYWFAVRAASAWGTTIKVAFILFRDDLRISLGLRKPVSYADERELWEAASEFFSADCSCAWLEDNDSYIFYHGENYIPEKLLKKKEDGDESK